MGGGSLIEISLIDGIVNRGTTAIIWAQLIVVNEVKDKPFLDLMSKLFYDVLSTTGM
jgi:hypothetical protein